MHLFTEQNISESEKHVPSGGPASCGHSLLQNLLEDMPCAEEKQHQSEALREVLLALQKVWSKDGELVKQELTQFGFCSHYDGVQYSQFSSLIMQIVQKEQNGPEFLHSIKGTSALI